MFQLLFLFGLNLSFSATAYHYSTPVNLDGKDIFVYFNDGDTFQFQDNNKKASARLQGFNALESYGPVHQWGKWTSEELYENAQKATQNARSGHWHCHTSGAADKYGRVLANCPDLAQDQIRKGLAHAMFVEKNDYNQELLDIQKQAVLSKTGMWKKGAPDFILTSAHSPAEKELQGKAYDRFVSVLDGHSIVRNHANAYQTCEIVKYSPDDTQTASSIVYIPFDKRYGIDKATCRQTEL